MSWSTKLALGILCFLYSAFSAAASVCAGKSITAPAVPIGAIWQGQAIEHLTPPVNYGTPYVVAWINATPALECIPRGEKATSVEIAKLNLIERQPDESETLVRTFPADPRRADFVSALFQRKDASGQEDWFGRYTNGDPDYDPISAASIETWSGSLLTINLAKVTLPNELYHAWTEPRTVAHQGSFYRIAAYVRIRGSARLQFGTDFWIDLWSGNNGWSADCSTSNNCESWVSDWFGDTGGKFVWIETPFF